MTRKKSTAPTVSSVPTERDILMEFFNATNGPTWREGQHWGSNKSVGKWSGVVVNARGQVTGLSLSKNRLDGRKN